MPQAEEPVARRPDKLLAAASVKWRLAVASGAILVIGALIAPRATPSGLSTPQERAAPLLEEQVLVREIPLPFRGVQVVAARVREAIVGIAAAERQLPWTLDDFSSPSWSSRAAGFGVFVSDVHVLTHALALDGRTSVQVTRFDGTVLDGQLAAYEPSTGLALLQTIPSGTSPARQSAELPPAGALGVAIGRWDGSDNVVPVFVISVGGDRLVIDVTDDSVLPGMPLYDLDGELFAIAAGRDSAAAFPVREAASRLMSLATAGERHASIGIVYQELTGLLSDAFEERGVLISDLVEGGPADVAGVQAGDLLVAVGDTETESADTAARAMGRSQVGATTPLRVIRSGRSHVIEVTARSTYDIAALARTRADDTTSGIDARVLFALPVLEAAGIPPAARVLTVNGRVLSSRAQAQRELRAARRPVPVLVRHAGTQFFAAIEPAKSSVLDIPSP